MLAKTRRESAAGRHCLRPGAGLAHGADAAFRRVFLEVEEPDIVEVWIGKQALECMRTNARYIVLSEKIEPLAGGAMFQFFTEHLVKRIDVGGARGDIGEARIALHDMRFADSFEEAAPLAVVVRQHGDEAILGLIRP